jgi:dihydroneopterin aldolase
MTADGTDVVFVRQLPVDCVIGVHADERAGRQRLLISVEIVSDFSEAVASDRLDGTIDYVAVADRIRTIAANGEFRLIETLAVRLAEALLEVAHAVVVEIEKPAALPTTRRAGVRVERSRDRG